MDRHGTAILPGLAATALALAAPLFAGEATFRLVVDSVAESRSRSAAGETDGQLTLMPKLEGAGLEEAKGFRIRVTAAKDDTGRSLVPDEPGPARWEDGATGPGLWLRLASPARGATTVTVTGTVELWAPARDRASEVRVPKALARPGKPLVSAALGAAGVALKLAPRDETAPERVALSGREPDVEKVRAVRILRADGTEIGVSGRQRSADGKTATIELRLAEPAPVDATLVLGLLTKRSVLSVPFELKDVPLP